MTLKLLTGNEALALGALRAGVKVATGYPGTPSTGCIESLLLLDSADLRSKGVHVEWSTNEKVAFEIASGAAWAGQRALCTMKMSGVNVAYDSHHVHRLLGRRGRHGHLRRRRSRRERRHVRTGLARLRGHVRPAHARRGVCRGRVSPRPGGLRNLRAGGDAGVRASRDIHFFLLCPRRRGRGLPARGDPARAV